MKCFFTIVENSLSESYRKACWEICRYFNEKNNLGIHKEVFEGMAKDIICEFPELSQSYTSECYFVVDSINTNYATFTIMAQRTKIIEIMQYVIQYAQHHNVVLLVSGYLYRPDGTMAYFSKIKESAFPPIEKWNIEEGN